MTWIWKSHTSKLFSVNKLTNNLVNDSIQMYEPGIRYLITPNTKTLFGFY